MADRDTMNERNDRFAAADLDDHDDPDDLGIDDAEWERREAVLAAERARIAAENDELLADFRKWLEAAELAPKTVRRHVDNAWVYVSDYLLRDGGPTPAADGVWQAEGFFGWFFPREYLATPGTIGEQCATLKKLYGFMAERGMVAREDYDELLSELRDSKSEWVAAAASYDEWLDAIDRGEDVADHPLLP